MNFKYNFKQVHPHRWTILTPSSVTHFFFQPKNWNSFLERMNSYTLSWWIELSEIIAFMPRARVGPFWPIYYWLAQKFINPCQFQTIFQRIERRIGRSWIICGSLNGIFCPELTLDDLIVKAQIHSENCLFRTDGMIRYFVRKETKIEREPIETNDK